MLNIWGDQESAKPWTKYKDTIMFKKLFLYRSNKLLINK